MLSNEYSICRRSIIISFHQINARKRMKMLGNYAWLVVAWPREVKLQSDGGEILACCKLSWPGHEISGNGSIVISIFYKVGESSISASEEISIENIVGAGNLRARYSLKVCHQCIFV